MTAGLVAGSERVRHVSDTAAEWWHPANILPPCMLLLIYFQSELGRLKFLKRVKAGISRACLGTAGGRRLRGVDGFILVWSLICRH